MGIRGLTTFIAKQANKYLENYQLHDCYLVIDGNNISSQLYKWHCTRNDCFGGDYDKYAKVVYAFFKLLAECNITPLIVFDGGYEDKKIRTVYSRLKDRITSIQKLNSLTQRNISTFPLLMRDLFVGIVLQLGLRTVRCDLEADYEIACLAKSLDCPVLSYDSDFYVFDVLYIPFSTFEMYKHRVKNSPTLKFYVSCRLYRIEKFLNLYGGLDKSCLPLVAVLLGNDYIKKSVFRNFYAQIKLPKRRHMNSEQQRKITSVIKWMQNETFESALRKILGRLKKEERKSVANQIKLIAEGYSCTNSLLFQYLKIQREDLSNSNSNIDLNITNIVNDVTSSELQDTNDEHVEDSCSETSQSSSDSLELSLQEEPTTTENIPDWFREKYRKCEYPPSFMDILVRGTYFCIPQLEDYSNICSHHISVNILSAINKILSSGTSENLKYVARSERASVTVYKTPPCSLDLPTLSSLKDVNSEHARSILFNVLEITSENVIDLINRLPVNWQLYVLSMIYWIKNAKPKVAFCQVYSLVLCMLILNKIDKMIGYYRSDTPFLLKFESKLNCLLKSQREDTTNMEDNPNIDKLLNDINSDDCLLCFKELISYFQMDYKMATRSKLFDIHIVDCFAQFQSCLLHIKYLNMLLNQPMRDCPVSEFYDGTFLYNMCTNLMKRTDVDVYLNDLLKHGPSFLNCFKATVKMLVKIMSDDITTVATSKRRRRKNKSNVTAVTDTEVLVKSESDDESLVDMNNRFSLLQFAK